MIPLMPITSAWSDGPVLTYVSTTTQTTGATTFTFTNHNIGTASADRFVIVCAAGADVTSTRQVSSCTIGGTAATLIVRSAAAADVAVGMYGLLVPAGTTATITVTYSGSCSRSSISVYTLTKWTSTAPSTTDVVTGTALTQTLNLLTPYAAVTLACGYSVCGTGIQTLSGTSGITNDDSVRYETNFLVTVGRGPLNVKEGTLSSISTLGALSPGQRAFMVATFK